MRRRSNRRAASCPGPQDLENPYATRYSSLCGFLELPAQLERAHQSARCDWTALPRVLVEEASRSLEVAGSSDALALDETLVYASVKSGESDNNLNQWLTNFLDRQPSFRVRVRERRVRTGGIWCNSCRTQTADCPRCGEPFQRSPEKGVDTAIATDLLSLAWEGALNVAVLVSGDSDFVPAVERIQEKGLKVVNATWRNHGHELSQACWASFEVDSVVDRLIRS